jgi:hypothetical protein
MTTALLGLAGPRDGPPLPHSVTTHAMRMEFTNIQIKLFLFIAVMILIGLGLMVYVFLYDEGKQKPELDRPHDNHWIWSHENPSSSPLDLL